MDLKIHFKNKTAFPETQWILSFGIYTKVSFTGFEELFILIYLYFQAFAKNYNNCSSLGDSL
jgi:hypothetical protein